jgi:protoporphyrinogen oxidase
MTPHPPKGSVVVLGGGLAGLSTLWHLQKAAYDNSFLFEKEPRVGGLARSEVVRGFTFDYTGHLLHFHQPAVQQLVTGLLGDNFHFLSRNSWIFSKGVYSRYPFQTNLYGLPPEVVEECVSGYIAAHQASSHRSDDPSSWADYPSFQTWIDRTLGAGIARHFMVPYNEKLWTIPLQELTCEWMGRFVPATSLDQILEGAHGYRDQDPGYNVRFGYPIQGGIEALARAFSTTVKHIYLGYEMVQINMRRKSVSFSNGEETQYEFLVSSLPLPQMIHSIKGVPARILEAASRLRFASVFNVNFGVGRNLSDKHWVYVPEPEFVFYRVGFPHNFSPYQAPDGCGSIYVEIAYSAWRPLDKSQIKVRVERDLIKAGILMEKDTVLAGCCLDIPYAYVIYDHNYRRNVGLIKEYLEEQGIWTVGRYGNWEYSGMEEAIWQGKLITDRILGNSK